jgi:hypothetical protein
MYQTISELFLGLIVLAYSVFLAALSWWGLAPRLRPVLQTLGLLQLKRRRVVRSWMVQLKREELKSWTAARNDYSAPCSDRN